MSETKAVIDLIAPQMGASVEDARPNSIDDYLVKGADVSQLANLVRLAPVRAFQPLLRELLLGGSDDFWIRLYVMRELLADEETHWTQESLSSKFSYFEEEPRRDIIRRLTRGGWLVFEGIHYSVTPLGEAATSLTGLLGDLANHAGNLGLMVHSLKIAKAYGVPAHTQLDQLRHKLSSISQQMERAYDSKSEHAILEARKLLESSLPWVESARQVLETYTIDTPEEHERVRSAHDLLSRLHHWVSALQRALNDIGRRRVHLGEGGLTMRDITAFLARADVNTLIAMAGNCLHFPVEQRHVIADNILSEAEYELCFRELPEEARRGWTVVKSAESIEMEVTAAGPIEDFVADAKKLVIEEKKTVAVSRFVERESWATTAYRFTLLAMAGGREESGDDAEAGGPGRLLATLAVDVEFDHTRHDRTDGVFSSEMTAGWIAPRREITAEQKNKSEQEVPS